MLNLGKSLYSFIVVFKVLRVYPLIFKFEIFHHVLKMTFCLLTNCKLCRNMCQCTTSVVLTCPGTEYLVGTFLLVLWTYISITSLLSSGAFSSWGPNSTAHWHSSSKLDITKTHYMTGKYILDKNWMNDKTSALYMSNNDMIWMLLRIQDIHWKNHGPFDKVQILLDSINAKIVPVQCVF